MQFGYAESVDFVQGTRPHVVNDRIVHTRRAIPKHLIKKPEAKHVSKLLYIGPPEQRPTSRRGLNEEVSDQDLKQYFLHFGKVVRVKQLKREGKKRGIGLIEFTDNDAVDKAMIVRNHFIKGAEVVASKPIKKENLIDEWKSKNQSTEDEQKIRMNQVKEIELSILKNSSTDTEMGNLELLTHQL